MLTRYHSMVHFLRGVEPSSPQTLKAVMVTIAFNPQKKPTLPNNFPSRPILWYSQANHCFRVSLLPVLPFIGFQISPDRTQVPSQAPKGLFFHNRSNFWEIFRWVRFFGNFLRVMILELFLSALDFQSIYLKDVHVAPPWPYEGSTRVGG